MVPIVTEKYYAIQYSRKTTFNRVKLNFSVKTSIMKNNKYTNNFYNYHKWITEPCTTVFTNADTITFRKPFCN